MITANLQKKATLATMKPLSAIVQDRLATTGTLEAPRRTTTPVDELDGRNGYVTGFLTGWDIPLPQATGRRESDMLPLRRGGMGIELKYRNFSVIMSRSRRMPMITGVNILGGESVSIPRRDDNWLYDGRIDESDQWGNELYERNILDRGHMVRREDPVWGEEAAQANTDTFHFPNCCPQVAEINQKVWLGLENYILHNARTDQMMVSVFTGPIFSHSDLEYRGARIPNAFWKVVAIVLEDGRPSATAYKISQEKRLGEGGLEIVYGAYKTFQVSIRQVSDETGLDFSGLEPYDGYSHEEERTRISQEKELLELGDVRL